MQSPNDHETLARLHYSYKSEQQQNNDGEFHIGGCKREADEAGLDLEHDGIGLSSDEDVNEMPKKSPPPNGKKTKGRVKIKMEFIDNKLRRYTTFSKRKTGIMKKAYELSTLTGTQVMLLVASETGHVYTFATRKLQPMITSEAGKALIQTCLNSPDPLLNSGHHSDQRMSATGFEETELTYSINDEESKMEAPKSQGLYGGSPQIDSPSHHSPSLAHISGATLLNSQNSPTSKSNNVSMQLPTATSFTTILSQGAMSPGAPLPSMGSLPSMHHSPGSNGHMGNSHQQQTVFKFGPPTSSCTDATTHNTVTIVPTSHQNLSVVSGNMVNLSPVSTNSTSSVSGTVMYQTSQGVVYASPSAAALSEGLLFNLGQSSGLQLPQETGGSSSGHQYITIPVSLTPTSQIVKAPPGMNASNGVATNVEKNSLNTANCSKSPSRK